MYARKTILGINIAVFSVVAILHLLRVILSLKLKLAGRIIPFWFSIIVAILLAILIYYNIKQLKGSKK